MPYISEDIIEEILDNTDIIDIINNYITLKKSGQNFTALCPFHNEKTPSFVVSPQKQIFHCFGCGVGGNAISFIQLYEKISFVEAVKKLAELIGYSLPESKEYAHVNKYKSLYEITEWVADLYYKNLDKNNKQIKNFLIKRNIKKVTCDIFKLGYAPDQWDFIYQKAIKSKIDINKLIELGILVRGKNNQIYDRFRNRFIFPIFNTSGKIVAFGGRIISDDDKFQRAKYINSPESAIFKKSNFFYGLYQNLHNIQKQNEAIIVEGYMDVLALYQAGFKNVIATLGTAFNENHLKNLIKFTNKITLLFDSDMAGLKAAYNSSEIILSSSIECHVCLLKKGEDPDSMVNKFGKDAFYKKLKESIHALDFRWKYISKIKKELSHQQQIEEFLNFFSKVKDPILKEEYITLSSRILNIGTDILKEKISQMKKHVKKESKKQNIKINLKNLKKEEKALLYIILKYPEYLKKFQQDIHIEFIESSIIRNILENIIEYSFENDELPDNYLIFTNTVEEQSLLSELMINDINYSENKIKDLYNKCILKLKLNYIDKEISILNNKLKNQESMLDEETLNKLLTRLEKLLNHRRELNEQLEK